nr:MAG TPA: hypothetical protein [Caudoviricetes sp.]
MTLQDISDRIAPCEYIKLIDKGINKVTWCGLGCNIPCEYMNKSVTNIYSKVYYNYRIMERGIQCMLNI